MESECIIYMGQIVKAGADFGFFAHVSQKISYQWCKLTSRKNFYSVLRKSVKRKK